MMMYHLVIRFATKRAVRIITISNYVKEDIKKELKMVDEKIIVIKEGFDLNSSSDSVGYQTILKKYGIISSYLLYVGNAYPHKNLEKLCDAFIEIKRKNPEMNLVIVGGEDYFFNKLKQYIKINQIDGVIFPGFVSDKELDAFYRGAKVFVFPSLYEGFGLPPLEALAKGVAVVSSDRTSMPEVLGDTVQYFDPESVDSIIRNIVYVLESKDRRSEIIKKGEERLKLFSWKKMARETLDVYRNNVL
jgi:glycosyltransferase involved in cell wall biosynthesis